MGHIMLEYRDLGARWVCSCGWSCYLVDERTSLSLELAVSFAAHDCPAEPCEDCTAMFGLALILFRDQAPA